MSRVIVASIVVRLHLPESRSLKDKRQVVQSLLRKLRDRHNVSAVELEDRDRWQLADLGLALAAADRAAAEARVQKLRDDVEALTGLKYVDFDVAYL